MLQDVKIADIEKYYNYKAVTGRLDGKPGGLSCRTLKIHGTILSLIFKKAIREELIRDNPCQYARLPKKMCIRDRDEYASRKAVCEGCEMPAMEAAIVFIRNLMPRLNGMAKALSGGDGNMNTMENMAEQCAELHKQLKHCLLYTSFILSFVV